MQISDSRISMQSRQRIEAPIFAQDELYYYAREDGATVIYSKRWYTV